MFTWKKTVALAATAAVAVSLTACGGSGSSTGAGNTNESLNTQAQYNPQPYDNIKDGGTLTTALPEITPQFNVWQGDATLYTRNAWNWYNPLLITFGPTGDVVYNPDYLTDVKADTVDGNTRITYTINPKATYNDGSPIDWTSFEAVWKADNGKDPAYIPSGTDGYDRITSVVRGSDDRQAVVTFDGVNLWWQSLFNNLLNPKALTPEAFNKGYLDSLHPEWGAGPYQVSKYDKQNGILTFVRNPKWWGKPGKLDSRTFLAMDSTASVNAFKNGQLDAVSAGTKDSYAQVQGIAGTEIRKSTSPQTDFFTLNGASPIFSDPQVRKAVLEGVDRVQIGKIQFQGVDFSETPPGSMVLLPFQKGYDDAFSKVITYSPDQAKKDLDAAGWVAGPDGMRSKAGKPLAFTYVNTGDSATFKAVASAIAAMMKDIGATMTIRQVSSTEYSTIVTGKQFDMFYSGVSQTDPFGIAYICQVYCSNTQLLKSGVNAAALDPEIQKVNTLPTPEAQFAAAAAAEEKALATYGVMPATTLPAIYAVKTGLANYGAGQFFTATPENVGWQK